MAYRKTKQLREFEPILLRNGYRFARCKGSHFIYMNRTSHKIIAVNKDLNKMVRERLIKWLCYKNFDEWYQKNVYEIGNERMHLDKDIKYRGNKVYSPYHCILVPQSINEQFRENRKIKDADLPYTIHRTTKGKYSVAYRGVSLGTFDTVEESAKAYVTAKRENIKSLVTKYNNMPDKVKQIILNAEIR